MFIAFAPYAPALGSRFPQTPQGKVAELRQELHSGGKKDKNYSAKKIALKKIVANMTMSNNDMVALFPDVIECMNLPSLEIKKMYVGIDKAPASLRGNLLAWRSGSLIGPLGASSSWLTTRE
jgi:hypothetical protein